LSCLDSIFCGTRAIRAAQIFIYPRIEAERAWGHRVLWGTLDLRVYCDTVQWCVRDSNKESQDRVRDLIWKSPSKVWNSYGGIPVTECESKVVSHVLNLSWLMAFDKYFL